MALSIKSEDFEGNSCSSSQEGAFTESRIEVVVVESFKAYPLVIFLLQSLDS